MTMTSKQTPLFDKFFFSSREEAYMLALGNGAVVCKKGRMVREYKNELVYQRQTSEREHMIDLMLFGVPAVAALAAYALKSTPNVGNVTPLPTSTSARHLQNYASKKE